MISGNELSYVMMSKFNCLKLHWTIQEHNQELIGIFSASGLIKQIVKVSILNLNNINYIQCWSLF